MVEEVGEQSGKSMITIQENVLPSRQALRRSVFSPPWMMAKRFCLSGFLLAAMQRSSQRIDLCMASSTRGPVTVLLTTSSSCIMMSDPESNEKKNTEQLPVNHRETERKIQAFVPWHWYWLFYYSDLDCSVCWWISQDLGGSLCHHRGIWTWPLPQSLLIAQREIPFETLHCPVSRVKWNTHFSTKDLQSHIVLSVLLHSAL